MEHDVVQITVDLLNDNWNAANVDKPTIGISEDIKRLDLNNKDGIIVYETGPKLREKGNLFYSVEDLNSFVSIDIRTVKNRTRLYDLITEVDRIRILKRNDPHTDWHTIYHLRSTPFTNKHTLLWREVVEWRFVRRKVSL